MNADRGERGGRRASSIRMMEDPYFRKHFRMTKETFERLIVAVGRTRRGAGRLQRERLPIAESILMGLWVIFNQGTFRSTGFTFLFDQSVVHRHYRLLVLDLCDLGPYFVKWPTPVQRLRTAAYFEENFGFPGIVGMIDGCRIKITAPRDQKQRYVDKDGQYSMNIMLVADHRRVIIHYYGGQPGSVNDARVFRRSPLSKILYGGVDVIGLDEHLIGDKAYVLTRKMMTPYKNYGHLTDSQRNYNLIMSQCRCTVERTNALWKLRMARLAKLYCKSIGYTNQHISATVPLHNFILLEGHEPDGIVLEGNLPPIDVVAAMAAEGQAGANKREFIRTELDRLRENAG